jgi:hypothetical protein
MLLLPLPLSGAPASSKQWSKRSRREERQTKQDIGQNDRKHERHMPQKCALNATASRVQAESGHIQS